MKIAIMQPYLFPYIGYFQLLSAVDKLVFYDDVNFIKKGWINRNRILLNGNPFMLSIPLKNASQNTLIKDLELAIDEKWKNKIVKTLEHAYHKAPFFEETIDLVKDVINTRSKFIKDWHLRSVDLIRNYFEISTQVIESTLRYHNTNLKGPDRILDICLKENANHYINPIGGKQFYNKHLFSHKKISLNFLKSKEISYQQFDNEFVPLLSIIDVMMFNSLPEIRNMLKQYELIE